MTQSREEYNEKRRKDYAIPEVKAKKTAYYEAHKSDILERRRRYHARPEVKVRRKKRDSSPEKIAKNKILREKLKLEVFAIYSKRHSNSDIPCCRCCGESSDVKFLAVDHMDGRKHLPEKEQKLGGMKIYEWLMKNSYPNGFQILCHNCNCTKGIFGSCPHEREK